MKKTAVLNLHKSGAETVSGVGKAIDVSAFKEAIFCLDVTATATEAGDTLDLTIKVYDPLSGSWIPYATAIDFTQVLGNGGAKQETLEKINNLGHQIRLEWTIVDVATLLNQSFTFSVSAILKD